MMNVETQIGKLAREMDRLEMEIRGHGLIAAAIYPPGVNIATFHPVPCGMELRREPAQAATGR